MSGGSHTYTVVMSLMMIAVAQTPARSQTEGFRPTLKSLNVFVENSASEVRPCEIAGRIVYSSGDEWRNVKLRFSLGNSDGVVGNAEITIDDISKGAAAFDADINGGCHGKGIISDLRGVVSVLGATRMTEPTEMLSKAGETFVAADQQCLADYLAAVKAGGLEMRKKIAELIDYRCGYFEAAGTYITVLSKMGEAANVRLERGAHQGASGWVLNSAITNR